MIQALDYVDSNAYLSYRFSGERQTLKTARNMLELSKKVLEKVSFDRLLFRKELRKAIRWVNKEERMALYAWCLITYGNQYKDVISDCFTQVAA